MSTSLDSQIDLFIDANFNAVHAAQNFFKTNNESEINSKLNEMTAVQQSIEDVLKKKVRGNYNLFLQATDQINMVGVEIADVKHLIDNTQKLIQDVQSNNLSDFKVMRSNSLLAAVHHKQKVLQHPTTITTAEAGKIVFDFPTFKAVKSDMPVSVDKLQQWFVQANGEIDRCIIEKQFARAVDIVRSVRHYGALVQSRNSSQSDAGSGGRKFSDVDSISSQQLRRVESGVFAVADNVLERTAEQAALLAHKIHKNLLTLPNSQLWGASEQFRRLKLLVDLGEVNLAAESFALSQERHVDSILRSGEQHADALTLSLKLSRSFFGALASSGGRFLQLFHEDYEALINIASSASTKPKQSSKQSASAGCVGTDEPSHGHTQAMPLLLRWLQRQIETFVVAVSHQMRMSVHEHAAIVVNHLRQHYSERFGSNDDHDTAAGRDANYNMIGKSRSNAELRLSSAVEMTLRNGALSFLARCMENLFVQARQLDALQLHFGRSALVSALLPEVRAQCGDYSAEFMKELSIQVRQDNWSGVLLSSLTVPLQLRANQANADSENAAADVSKPVSPTYDWLARALAHLCEESLTLVRADVRDTFDTSDANSGRGASSKSNTTTTTNKNNNNNDCYTRSEFIEVEPSMCANVLRLLLHYVTEVEAVRVSSFSAQQLACYHHTILCMQRHMLPSVRRLVERCFCADQLLLAGGAINTSALFDVMAQRLSTLQPSNESSAATGRA